MNFIHRPRFLMSSRESRLLLMHYCLRARRPRTSSFKPQPSPLHSSWFSELLIMLSPADRGILKVFAILLRGIFSEIVPQLFVADWWRSPHRYIEEAQPLWNAPFVRTHIADLLPINLISRQMLLHLFLSCTCCSCSNFFLGVSLPSESKWVIIFHEIY